MRFCLAGMDALPEWFGVPLEGSFEFRRWIQNGVAGEGNQRDTVDGGALNRVLVEELLERHGDELLEPIVREAVAFEWTHQS